MTPSPADLPRPDPAPLDVPFWAALRNDELRIQWCPDCDAGQHPPRPQCARCCITELVWRPMSGHGELWSYTVCHPPTLPAFADRVPYVAAVVRLERKGDADVFMVTTLLEPIPDPLQVGAPVMFAPTRIDDELTLPTFRVVAER